MPWGGTGTFQNVPAHDAWAMGAGQSTWRAGQSIPGTCTAAERVPAQQRRDLGRARSWIPNLSPVQKNNHKHFCIQ